MIYKQTAASVHIRSVGFTGKVSKFRIAKRQSNIGNFLDILPFILLDMSNVYLALNITIQMTNYQWQIYRE